MDFVLMALQQHFADGGGVAKIAVNLERRTGIQ